MAEVALDTVDHPQLRPVRIGPTRCAHQLCVATAGHVMGRGPYLVESFELAPGGFKPLDELSSRLAFGLSQVDQRLFDPIGKRSCGIDDRRPRCKESSHEPTECDQTGAHRFEHDRSPGEKSGDDPEEDCGRRPSRVSPEDPEELGGAREQCAGTTGPNLELVLRRVAQ